jgi:hypothetical protein
MSLSGYDAYKLATPPEYSEDEPEHDDECGCGENWVCGSCWLRMLEGE